ncbi:MAG: hypothetical protein A2428_01080 [Bdellovibrionales bacterium RIFOXYC1_FULL_54_43]|nr:MAG: hypothetical protein A2428_01080 [Bdellovibrionales bacterium RIFOXYC1_FULL_54_43]OFZ82877.1 MAG: hypothetical protein A2603_11800 [Bdellovibrionales bacterium RIFOXYD1_FULL_55_31]
MIINGQRKLTLSAADKISNALSLTGKRRRYLMSLAKLDLARTQEEQARARHELLALRRGLEEAQIKLTQFRFLSEWYYPALYVLVGMDGFKPDYDLISRRMGRGLSQENIKTALQDLVTLGLVKEDQGRLIQSDGPIGTGDKVYDSAIYLYHKQMIGFALQALEMPREAREMNGLTVSIPKKQLPVVKEKIRAFRKDLNGFLSQDNSPGEVYQINIQLFPLTQEQKSED